ncbi:hypothetical protein HHI36_020476 [Cryptolaemus montrouzieri]|uniref:Uncharacterized protein n=1 Tax=Cryptolaemus montrouzieri TaxID=559131 RepID=A0ABD2NAD4_9CUCU
MIYNLKESNANNINERKKFDCDQVSGLIDELLTSEQGAGASSNEHDIEVIRVGKSAPDKPRVLKVVASSTVTVTNLLKNKINLRRSVNYSTVRIDGDLTIQQRQHLKSIRDETNRRK